MTSGTSLLVILLFAVVLSWRAVWVYGPPGVRVPLAWYGSVYAITTVLGATLLGLSDGRVHELGVFQSTYPSFLHNAGLSLRYAEVTRPHAYWILLYAPLIVPPLVALLFRSRVRWRLMPWRLVNLDEPVGFVPFLCAFAILSGYALTMMVTNGYIWMVASLLDGNLSYRASILLRADMMASLGGAFYGVVYMGLPALSHIALYQTLTTREPRWAAAFFVGFVLIVFLSLAIMQKAPLLIYLAFSSLSLFILGILPWRLVFLFGAGGVVALTAIQTFLVSGWSVADSVLQLVFRLAFSFPFYVHLYPGVLPFDGPDLGLDVLGIGSGPVDNLVVFQYMYPSVDWVQGSATAAAHVRAYAQAGVWFAIATLLFVSVLMMGVARLRQDRMTPLRYAAYVQGLVLLYYVTQTSIREALVASYGVIWSALAIILVYAATRFLNGVRGGSSASAARAPRQE